MSIESPHYALVIDQTDNAILGLLLEASLDNPIGRAVFEALRRREDISVEDINSFVNSFAEKEHEMGWCEDPDCRDKKEPI